MRKKEGLYGGLGRSRSHDSEDYAAVGGTYVRGWSIKSYWHAPPPPQLPTSWGGIRLREQRGMIFNQSEHHGKLSDRGYGVLLLKDPHVLHEGEEHAY